MKNGVYTTEFWLSFLKLSILPALVLFGVLDVTESDSLYEMTTTLLTAIGLAVSDAIVLWKYIQARTDLKAETSLSDKLEEFLGIDEGGDGEQG